MQLFYSLEIIWVNLVCWDSSLTAWCTSWRTLFSSLYSIIVVYLDRRNRINSSWNGETRMRICKQIWKLRLLCNLYLVSMKSRLLVLQFLSTKCFHMPYGEYATIMDILSSYHSNFHNVRRNFSMFMPFLYPFLLIYDVKKVACNDFDKAVN